MRARIAILRFLEVGYACSGTLALRVVLLARSRVTLSVSRQMQGTICNRKN